MLTFAEEIILLLLDDDTGELEPVSNVALNSALAGAVLMDLAFHGKIDTDAHSLTVIDGAPTGEIAIDLILAKIVAGEKNHDTSLLGGRNFPVRARD